MAKERQADWTRTFGELRRWVLEKAKVPNHFGFNYLGESYRDYWSEMNEVESRRGYDPVEYAKPGSPALCDMKLLTEKEFMEWVQKFEAFH